jgi:5S rRNA maturation endonuclease (ribonuclease M5)
VLRGVLSRDTQDTEVDGVGPNHAPIIPAGVRPICSPISTYDVGLSGHLGREVVPLYDEAGATCLSVVSRSVRPTCPECRLWHDPGDGCRSGEPRWMGLADFAKSTYLYNYATARSTKSPFIFLVEGAPDVWRLAEAGYVGVALLGSEASPEQMQKLSALGKEIWVALDADAAGEEARARLANSPHVKFPSVKFRPPQTYKDVGDAPVSALQAAVRDRVAGLDAEHRERIRDEFPFWFSGERERADARAGLHIEWLRSQQGRPFVGPHHPDRNRGQSVA